jgi:membrane-associated phospholipid phosphatase
MSLTAHFRQHRIYLALVALCVIGAAYFLGNYSKEEIHLFINGIHAPWADAFFPIYTYLGDGIIFPILLVPALFVKRYFSFSLLLAALLTLVLSGVLKQLNKEEPRPIKYFEIIDKNLRQIPGVKPHYYRSFPSGHTTAAFAAWGLIAISMAKWPWKIMCLLIAVGVAYSRMYLSMHFLRDVTAGALLGTFIAFIASYWSQRLKSEFWSKKWIDLT